MTWDLRRKLIYAAAVFIILFSVVVFFLRETLFPEPTCVDSKKNGYEVGVDCGGTCALRCTEEVSPLTVLWAKAVKGGNGVYDLVGMVNNNNIDNASYEMGYSFTLYDREGNVFDVVRGSTTAPLGGKFPIIIQNFPLTTPPASVLLSLTDTPHYKVSESPSSPTIRILARRYEAGSVPRVYTTIINTKHTEISNLPVRVLLFDDNDNVYAVGQTIIPSLEKEEIKEIIFTWSEPLQFTPTRIGIYPIFNPFEAIGY